MALIHECLISSVPVSIASRPPVRSGPEIWSLGGCAKSTGDQYDLLGWMTEALSYGVVSQANVLTSQSMD